MRNTVGPAPREERVLYLLKSLQCGTQVFGSAARSARERGSLTASSPSCPGAWNQSCPQHGTWGRGVYDGWPRTLFLLWTRVCVLCTIKYSVFRNDILGSWITARQLLGTWGKGAGPGIQMARVWILSLAISQVTQPIGATGRPLSFSPRLY